MIQLEPSVERIVEGESNLHCRISTAQPDSLPRLQTADSANFEVTAVLRAVFIVTTAIGSLVTVAVECNANSVRPWYTMSTVVTKLHEFRIQLLERVVFGDR